MYLWLALIATNAKAVDSAADIAPALTQPKKAKWDAKGKALNSYSLGNTKRKQDDQAEAISLLVQALTAQPGCGQCLSSLALALTSAKRYDDAIVVGNFLDQLYPDRSDGRRRVSDTLADAQRSAECVTATSRFLEMEKADTAMWQRRNYHMLQLAQFDEAKAMLDGAVAAGLSKEHTACLQLQVFAANEDPVAARELWGTCDLGEDLDLRRYSEGWLAMSERDYTTAAKRLILGAGDDFARLTVAHLRLDEGKPDLALNLVTKIEESPQWSWAIDLHLAHALALHGVGKDKEALELLGKTLMADGWPEKHRAYDIKSVLLKPHGHDWPKEVGLRAAVLDVTLLVAAGELESAKSIQQEAIAIYGDKPELIAALPPPPPPEPVTAKKPR